MLAPRDDRAGRNRIVVGPYLDAALEQALLDSEILEAIARSGDLVIAHGEAEFSREFRTADAILLTGQFPAGCESMAPRLRVISVLATGVHTYVDVPGANASGIDVLHVPSYGDAAVVEHALALIFALAKNLTTSHDATRRGLWPQPLSLQLSGATAGVIGLGSIGTRMVATLEALGMDVLMWTRRPEAARLRGAAATYATLEALVEHADVLSLHLAYTPETRGLITYDLLAQCRPGAIVVNTARAEIVEKGALEALVTEGRIRAAIDVFGTEPATVADIAALPDEILLTPHVGFNTAAAHRALVLGAVTNLTDYLQGRPVNVVNRHESVAP